MQDIYWRISEIAERDKLTSQAIAKTARRLVEIAGLPVKRDARGRIAEISVAHYDVARERFQNPARSRAAPSLDALDLDAGEPPLPAAQSESFEEARRRNEWLKVGRETIRHQEDVGQLVRADKLGEAVAAAAREIQSAIARLPNRADDIAQAIAKEGVHGVRMLLGAIAFEITTAAADRLAVLAAGAPLHDDMIETEADASRKEMP